MFSVQTTTYDPSAAVKSITYSKILYRARILLIPAMFVLIDFAGSKDVVCSGIVLDKHYTPERIHLTKVKELDQAGRQTSRLESEIEPASWEILTQSESGKSLRLECQREVYYAKNTGEPVEYVSVQGFLTNWVYKYRGITSSAGESLSVR